MSAVASKSKQLAREAEKSQVDGVAPPRCGIIMPIGPTDGCSSEHWSEVRSILEDCIRNAEMTPLLVSDADDVGVIHKRIINNVYSSALILCDVSGKNPNVMFELGMRLAFDRATVIVKDDQTSYSFDTSVMEHLGYPRDLRFNHIVDFKEKLTAKLRATLTASVRKGYSAFLNSFGEYEIAAPPTKSLTGDAFIVDALDELRSELSLMRARLGPQGKKFTYRFETARGRIKSRTIAWALANSIHDPAKLRERLRDLWLMFIDDPEVRNEMGPDDIMKALTDVSAGLTVDDLAPF